MPEIFQSKNRIKKENRRKGVKGKEAIYDRGDDMKPKEKIILERHKQLVWNRNIYNGGWRGQCIALRKPLTLNSRIRRRIKRNTHEEDEENKLPIPKDFDEFQAENSNSNSNVNTSFDEFILQTSVEQTDTTCQKESPPLVLMDSPGLLVG